MTSGNEQEAEEDAKETNSPSEASAITGIWNNFPARKLLTGRLILVVMSACFGSIGVGTAYGYTGPAVPQMQVKDSHLVITKDEGDLFGAAMSIGALVGGLVTGLFIDNLGRRLTFIVMSSVLGSGYFIISFSVDFAMLLSGRILVGLCVGIIMISVPIYIAELSPPSIRGLLTSLAQVSVCLGVLITYILGYFLFWNYLAMACTVWPILTAILMLFMPESPSWLIKKGKTEAALNALKQIRPTDFSCDEELKMLSEDIKRQETIGGFDIRLIFEPSVYKPLLISVFLMIATPLTGINVIIFNVVFMFQSSGSTIDPGVCSIIIGIILFVATSVATFLIERLGRRPVLLYSCVGMFISHGALGIYYLMVHLKGREVSEKLGWFPLLCLIFYMLSFVGFGLGPWVLIPEISPFRVRGFIGSVANASQWVPAFIVTNEFSGMIRVFKIFGLHFFYFGCLVVSFVIVYLFLPETKGLSFKEIEKKFEKPRKCHKNSQVEVTETYQ